MDQIKKKLFASATSLEGPRTTCRLIIYSHNHENMAKIGLFVRSFGPVDVEIINMREIETETATEHTARHAAVHGSGVGYIK